MESHVPLQCDICGAPTRLVHNLEIYGRPVGVWEWHILCTDEQCGAHVETRPGTAVASGRMSTPETRRARISAHRVFDRLWSTPHQRRNAYAWLAEQMGLTVRQCHIKLFDYDQCQEVIRLVRLHNPVIADMNRSDPKLERIFRERKKPDTVAEVGERTSIASGSK